MRPALLALGVFGTVVGLFLFVTGYRMTSIPPQWAAVYREDYYLGVGLEILGGILTAVGLGLAVFGAVHKKKEGHRTAAGPSTGQPRQEGLF